MPNWHFKSLGRTPPQSEPKQEEQNRVRSAYERRYRDPDPKLVWRAKVERDWSDLVTQIPPPFFCPHLFASFACFAGKDSDFWGRDSFALFCVLSWQSISPLVSPAFRPREE